MSEPSIVRPFRERRSSTRSRGSHGRYDDRVAESFHWREARSRLEDLLAEGPLVADEKGRAFVREGGLEFRPPLVLPAPGTSSPEEWLAGLPAELGTEVVFLIQAGASALGLWRADEVVVHKAEKKYVVRGTGKAQPTYLKTKGKSRYGSRLRLRNARSLLEEVCERLGDWFRDHGPVDRMYYSCPVRIWGDLFRTRPELPFDRKDPRLVRIPLDVDVPNFAELERVRERLVRGRIVRPSPGSW